MKNKILSFLLVALATSSYAQESAPTQTAPSETSATQTSEEQAFESQAFESQAFESQIPVEQVAFAEEDSAESLDDYAVTAYRFATPQLDTPVNTTVITAQDIAESFSTNIADVLQKKANVQFKSTTSGLGYSSVSMRGFGENSDQRVLVIIDGQRMNRADMGNINWNQIPLEYIESIEVMRGSQSAMYGNNAMGGVIKITTKRGSAEDTYSANFSGGSYGMYNVNGLVTGSYENWTWSADVGRFYTDGYRDNSYEWTNSYNFAATKQLSDALKLSVSANFSQSEFGMAGALTSWDSFYSDPTQAGNVWGYSTEDDYYALQEGIYTIALTSNTSFGEGEVAFSANVRNIDSSMPSWGASYSSYDPYWGATNDQLTLNFTPKYKFNLTDDASVIVGLDFEYVNIDAYTAYNYDKYKTEDYVNYTYDYTYLASDNANVERLSIAPYIAGEMQVAEKFIFTAAARYEYTNTKFDCYGINNYNDKVDSDGLAANIGITYKINKNSSVYFRFDQVYNSPSTDEIAAYQGYSYMYTNFNSDLKPEQGQNYEIGYKYIDENWTANANVFLMYLRNEIAYDATYYDSGYGSYSGLNVNYDPTLRYGFDYQIAYDDKYWGASLMGSIMKAEFASGSYSGNDIPLVPNYSNTFAVYVKPLERLRLTMTLNYNSSSYLGGDIGNEYQKASDYFLLGFIAEIKVAKYATLYFGIENALGEDYLSYGTVYESYGTTYYSLYPACGRVFKVGLNLTF